MHEIRPITSDADFAQYAAIAGDAYPGTKVVSEQDRQRLTERLIARSANPFISSHGIFEGGRLLGAMRLHDFTLNARGAKIKAGGVGFVAVDLLHKKEHVAKELLEAFLRICQQRGQHMAMLYPFRPDFYRQMGFGYGAKISQYRVRPAHLPRGSKAHLHMLTAGDKPLLAACYSRFASARHGLIDQTPAELDALFNAPENRIVGYKHDGEIQGYLVFSFAQERQDNFFLNNIVASALVYQHRAALAELLAFLHSQADQIAHVIFNTGEDSFHQLLFDPRNGTNNLLAGLGQETNTQGLGIMYRALNTAALFEALGGCDFNGQSCKLKIAVRDTFLPANNRDVETYEVIQRFGNDA